MVLKGLIIGLGWVRDLFLLVLELLGVGALWSKLVLALDANRSARFVRRLFGHPFRDLLRVWRSGLFELGAGVDVRRREPFAFD